MFSYFWLRWVFVAACELSLVAVSEGYSLVAVHALLTEVASLVEEHRHVGSIAVALKLSCSSMWDLPKAGTDPVSPALQDS